MRAAVRHPNHAGAAVVQRRIDLVRKRVAWTRFGGDGPSGLDDVSRDDAVKHGSVKERLPQWKRFVFDGSFGEPDEIRHGHRGLFELELHDDESFRRPEFGIKPFGIAVLTARRPGESKAANR